MPWHCFAFFVIDPHDIALILSSPSEQGSLKSPLAFSCDAVKRVFSLKPRVPRDSCKEWMHFATNSVRGEVRQVQLGTTWPFHAEAEVSSPLVPGWSPPPFSSSSLPPPHCFTSSSPSLPFQHPSPEATVRCPQSAVLWRKTKQWGREFHAEGKHSQAWLVCFL